MPEVEVLRVDLSGERGHVMLIGGPDADQRAVLHELINGIAVLHTPEQVQFYFIDIGRRLADLATLPHVGAIAGKRDDELVRRIVLELAALLRRRQESFARLGIRDIAEFRDWQHSARAAGAINDPELRDGYGDVFLVVDHWMVLTEEFEDLVHSVNVLGHEGLAYGIHLILVASKRFQIRPLLHDVIKTEIDMSPDFPSDRLVRPMLVVEPLFGEPAAVESRGASRAPEIRLLPTDITRAEVLRRAESHGISQGATRVVLGITESELQPQAVDFDIDPHLLILGDTECGKTTVLRNIIRGITDFTGPEWAQILVVDPCRTLLGAVPSEYLAGYATKHDSTTTLMRDLADYLAKRLPGPDLTPRQIRERDWWTGPEIFLLVDDYERVTRPGSASPFAPLIELLREAQHLGFHLILTRRMSRVRDAFTTDPFLAALHTTAPAVLLMSGSRDEGRVIADTRPMPLPPGRAIFVTRRTTPDLIQLSNLPGT
ncbi:FtsK/SpoIIIE domain-containing protein [Nocardia sp. NPDC058058]|uniref:FtsK/SpoIIIE domain-containing protein n=1 Tax=Nocardia sp. NPDC058058 TaxID=3346317 RepID=UPI0036DEEC81